MEKVTIWGTALLALAAGCRPAIEVGLVAPYRARTVHTDLTNPSCVTFSPRGELTVVDSGNGAVFLWARDGRDCPVPIVTGFDTEHWKVDGKTGTGRFKLGPLSAVWLNETALAVTDGGKPDGRETVNFYLGPSKTRRFAPRTAVECRKSNPVGPTTKEKADRGEGNLTGMCLSADGSTLYVCGQGSDARTWVLSCDVRTRRLEPLLSADAAGIEVNSPMQCLYRKPGWLYVLYSGEGGKQDGLLVRWDLASGAPDAKWKLPGLADPMGMAFVPGSGDELAVVDNNWDPKTVKPGKLARVKLVEGKGEAEVRIIATGLRGPVSCAFGPDGRLYVAQLGEVFDGTAGSVIAVSGFSR